MVASRNCVPLPKLPSGATLNLESPGWGANSREWGGKLSTGGRVWPGAALVAACTECTWRAVGAGADPRAWVIHEGSGIHENSGHP